MAEVVGLKREKDGIGGKKGLKLKKFRKIIIK
jgi:hypothetical protein